MNRSIGIGLIGLGYWGPNLARNVAAADSVTLAAVCDANDERLKRIASIYPGARPYAASSDLIADPNVDAVIVATPVATHFLIAKEALEAGKHVLVEKPMATRSEDIVTLDKLAREQNLTLMVNHVFLYHPAVQKLIALHDDGELGDILFVDSVRINLGMFQSDVNVMWDLAPHDLSIINHLLRREPRSVSAIGGALVHTRHIDLAYLHLDYGDNILVAVHVNWLSPVKLRNLLVGGSRRSVVYNDLDVSEPIKIFDRGVTVERNSRDRDTVMVSYRSGDILAPNIPKVEALANSIGHFADCINTGQFPLTSAKRALDVVRVLEAADRSLASGGAAIALSNQT